MNTLQRTWYRSYRNLHHHQPTNNQQIPVNYYMTLILIDPKIWYGISNLFWMYPRILNTSPFYRAIINDAVHRQPTLPKVWSPRKTPITNRASSALPAVPVSPWPLTRFFICMIRNFRPVESSQVSDFGEKNIYCHKCVPKQAPSQVSNSVDRERATKVIM
jgi:hypothetical protein